MPNDTCNILVSESFKSQLDEAKGSLSYTEYIQDLILEHDSE